MAVHKKRVAGIIELQVDGEIISAKGSFEYRLHGVQNEAIDNADGTTAIGGKFVGGYIKGVCSNYAETDHKRIKDAEGVTVTLTLGTGKVIVAKDAFQTDEAVGSVEGGEFPIQFDSDNVEEVR